MEKEDPSKISLFLIKKGDCTFFIPPSWFGKLHFELLSPKSLISELEKIYQEGYNQEPELCLTNYRSDEELWN